MKKYIRLIRKPDVNLNFKGFWIKSEIVLNPELSAIEKLILAYITSLNTSNLPCYASNLQLADIASCTERQITRAITKLKDLGYVTVKLTTIDNKSKRVLAVYR